ncbi:E3 ubiquitin-protein ligase RNF115-like isoform X2 [Tubulanus polymorphus]|uniref:E3 ubiquitin-protein ligase RNF115-like isoform X2 n=1 Tax=Tubulanus polymorphus TaxID=672921 RepID=UPI003DA4A0E0
MKTPRSNTSETDYTCPRCQSGFIELMGDDFDDSEQPPPLPLDPAAQFAELWERTFMDSFRLHTNGETDNNRPNDDPDRDQDESEPAQTRSSSSSTRHRARPFLPRTRVSIRRNAHDNRGPAFEGIINQLLGTLAGGGLFQPDGFPVGMFQLHASPGDYAWGAEGLDAIVTHLLNQLEGQGVPPATKNQIDDLPRVSISQEQVEKTLQCTVCMEDFKLGENVRKLPCDHYYHTDCIVPWLERHGSCPICRKDLNGEDTSNPPTTQTSANGGVDNLNNDTSMFDLEDD